MAVRKSATTQGKDYLFASESVVADASGFSEWEDVKPGMYALPSLRSFLICGSR